MRSLVRQIRVRASSVFFVVFIVFFSLALFCSANDTITQGQFIRDGESSSASLVSAGKIFELGFFSGGKSGSRFVGIWYRDEQTVVWVANRANPIPDRTGVLRIGSDGNLVILDGSNNTIWKSNASNALVNNVSKNSTAKLNDDGNLVLLNGKSVGPYWQSFNNPTDTYLPGMKIEVNTAKGDNRIFTSWKSSDDPSPGNFTMGVDPRASPQIVIWQGQNRQWRSGYWNGLIFTGVPDTRASFLYGFKLAEEEGRMFLSYVAEKKSSKFRFRIEWNGLKDLLNREESSDILLILQPRTTINCDLYNVCGKFAVCNSSESPSCRCMEGFKPSNLEQWSARNWSGGCSRKTQLKCQTNRTRMERGGEEDGFVVEKLVKLPDFADLVPSFLADRCKDECLKNCSCIAYAFVNGIGCMIWKQNLLDVQQFKQGGSTLNIRVDRSDIGGQSTEFTPLITLLAAVGAAIFGLCIWIVWRFKLKLKGKSKESLTDLSRPVDVQGNTLELPLFSFNFVETCTNNFSEENKLGQGGFGPVYKGKLPEGQEIAVKRLSRKSGQGLEEFKNEIILIAKLQHRNLVRLLGCCIQGEEKMLLYEYMPNKSLDFFLFDLEKQALLDWNKRVNIIEGITRGLLYLHRDSRLRIIHRDLKASNILLDEEMNPKISDFGMARIFGGNQNQANTNRVVGTYGYMSPEYAMEGLFSVKSDVYSFGVLLLEIVSGRRNTSFHTTEYLSLIVYAWHLWTERRAVELLDPSIADTCSQDEVLRCIQVGLLCVQDSPLHRPTISSVVSMLESEAANIPLPRQPTFTSMLGLVDSDLCSLNDLTVTMVDGR